MQTSITDPQTRNAMPMLTAYKYDQLNRILESRSYETGLASNIWNPTTYGNSYFNSFTYNADGNILTQKRHRRDGSMIDNLTYHYQRNDQGNFLSNRLYHVNDAIDSLIDNTDLDDMGEFEDDYLLINSSNNYSYDEEGRLKSDSTEQIANIVWRLDGKVKSIIRPISSSRKNLIFDYDAMGNRIAKHIINPQTDMLEKSTYYILDAQGQQISMYEHIVDSNEVRYLLSERNIYGSNRIGVTKGTINMYDPQTIPSYGVIGNRQYELTNHLGNVLSVISDFVTPIDDNLNEEVDGYAATIISVSDYSPFGVLLQGRSFANPNYRYGFNGKEKDDEFKGNDNSYDFGARIYDPRIGRFFSPDPKESEYPFQSTYCFAGNNPIQLVDENGEGPKDPSDKFTEKFNKWKAKNNESLKGKNGQEMYDLFKQKYGDKKWFVAYENKSSISKSTAWTVTEKGNNSRTKTFNGKAASGGTVTKVMDLGGESGTIDLHYDMLNEPDRLILYNDATNEILFDTKKLFPTTNGFVYGEDRQKIDFSLGEGNTKVRIVVNPNGPAGSATAFSFNLRVKTKPKPNVLTKVSDSAPKIKK